MRVLYGRPREFPIKCRDLQHVITHGPTNTGAVRKPSRPLRCHQEVRTARYPAPRAVSYLGFFTGGPTEARAENSPSDWPAKAASGWTKPYEHTSSKAA